MQHKNRYDICGKEKPQEDSYFHEMLRHYGFHNFTFDVLEECRRSELNEREKYYIKKFNTIYPHGYNKTRGGELPASKKMTDDKLSYIIKDLSDSKLSEREIAEKYSLHLNTISTINLGKSHFCDDIEYPIRKHNKTYYYCEKCGAKLYERTRSSLCRKCYSASRRKYRPPKDELYKFLLNNTFAHAGRTYDVGVASIRKWCAEYGIPTHASDYLEIKANDKKSIVQ